METIIIQLTKEEFKDLLIESVLEASGKLLPKQSEIKYLTRKEAAKKLHITLPTLNKWTKSGNIKSYRIEGRVLYREDEINEVVESGIQVKYKRS